MQLIFVCGLLVVSLITIDAQPVSLIDDGTEAGANLTERERPIGGPADDVVDKSATDGTGSTRWDGADNETDSRREGQRFYWQHILASGESVSEKAFAPNGSNVIIYKSKDRSLRSQNISRTISYYFFAESNAIVAVVPLRQGCVCYIRNSSLNYQGAIDQLAARNGSTVTLTQAITLDGSKAPLSREEKTAFLETNPGLRDACKARSIILTNDVDKAESIIGPSETIVALTLENDFTIIVPSSPDVKETRRGRCRGSRRRGGDFWRGRR